MVTNKDMSGKTALVMGGALGTGKAIALAFAARGANVVIADIRDEKGEATAQEILAAGNGALYVHADMADSAMVQGAVEQSLQAFGGLHMAANNAALGVPNQLLTEISEEDYDRCMGVTLRGVWLCLKHQLPAIEASGGGAIVNVASVSGLRGDALQSVYSAAKGGVIALSKSAAVEFARRGVRVNTVCPGGINSGGMAFYLQKMEPRMREKTLEAHAMGRLAQPREIGDAVTYLCSESASFITGHDLVVDGGIMVRSNVAEL